MWKLSIYEYESYKVVSHTWHYAQIKTSRLDYNKTLKHSSVYRISYMHYKLQNSIHIKVQSELLRK